MTRVQLKRMLKPLLLQKTKAQRRALYAKKHRARYPLRAEKEMRAVISKIYAMYVKKITLFFEARRPLYASYDFLMRKDSFDTEFEQYINTMASSVDSNLSIGLINGISLEVYVGKILEFIKTFDEKELERAFASMFSMGIPSSDSWWQGLRSQLMDEFSKRTAGTIKEYLNVVRELALDGIRKEIPFDELVNKIRAAGQNLTLTRANFLARDLTGKINGLFTKNLHGALGMTHYLFTTAYDERVRGRPGGVYSKASTNHWALDSKVCSWSDPTIYSLDLGRTFVPRTGNMLRLHPGMDWACRCVASPWFKDIFLEVEQEIRGEY